MKHFPASRRLRSIGIGGALAALFATTAAGPALASTPSAAASACTAPAVFQPFLSVKDDNWYAMAPGESPDSFAGIGWTLTGGAQIKTTQLADGSTGSVLDLPSGSKAVSPIMCVDNGYLSARTEVRDLAGSQGVFFSIAYDGTGTWGIPQTSGQVHGQQTGWTLSTPVNLQPSVTPGWQLAQFTFVPGGTTSDFQLYNFWVDPRMTS